MPQSLAKVYVHVIFSTKNRVPVLADEWRDELFHVLGGTANNLGCQTLIVGQGVIHAYQVTQRRRFAFAQHADFQRRVQGRCRSMPCQALAIYLNRDSLGIMR